MQQKNSQPLRSLPLHIILITPFVLQIVAAIAITGWVSYQNGQRTVSNLASELLIQAKFRVKERLDRLLQQSQFIVKVNRNLYQNNQISLERIPELQEHFWQQIQRLSPSQHDVFIGDEQGRFVSVHSNRQLTIVERPETHVRFSYLLDHRGKRQKLLGSIIYDPRKRPWYQESVATHDEVEPIWTNSYLFSSGELGITSAQAIRDSNEKVVAVSGVDVGLNDFDKYLSSIHLSASSQLFLIERSGRLVAASHKPSNINVMKDGKLWQRALVTDTDNTVMRESTKFLIASAGSLDRVDEPLSLEFSIEGKRYFLSILPYHLGGEIDWLVAIVVPEKDFDHQIQENNRTTLLLCGISLFVAITIGMLTSRSLIKPIIRLTESTDKISQGKWESATVSNGNSKEINTLVNSFDSMVERLHEVFNTLETFAYVDALTGLPNRAAFLASLQQAIAMTKQPESQSFAVVLLELQSFQLIESSLGPAIADLLLKSVATRLKECLEVDDGRKIVISRLERDEFAILIQDISGESEAVASAQTIIEAFHQPFHLGQQDVLAEAIIGVVVDPEELDLPEEILRNVNLAKFSAKVQGHQRYVIFDGLMRLETTERLQLAADLRYAIARNEFELWYQPIVMLDPVQIGSFEALIRWQHSTLGLISPLKFIPIAEENGTIVSIGEWVLRAACLQKLAWNKQDPTMQAVQVSVNVSAQQLLSPNFADQVERILLETGLEGGQIQLEITESAAVSQPTAIGQTLKRIQSLGIKICIDDFGTGYSHLSHLLQLPIDILKIDRSFIRDINIHPKNAEIAKTIIALTNCLGIEAIAEGVETSVQLEHLRSLQCKKFQGYLFSPPLQADRILGFSPTLES